MKVLIIKLGYSETLDAEISRTSSLGDVLRTTVLLHAFKDDQVTWLIDEAAYPLLHGNPFIHKILPYDITSILQLQHERFDKVINLEKVPGLCALTESINAWRKYGFRFDEIIGAAESYDGCEIALEIAKDIEKKKAHTATWQESLFNIVGEKWNGQEYILGYKPETEVIYDVGLNYSVGSKWPNKAWPKENWNDLGYILTERNISCSYQQGMKNLYEYINWINSCRVIVTNDSLGLHIALALKKSVVVLYGPTHPGETFFYGRAEVLEPLVNYQCIPCLLPICEMPQLCMEFISPQRVASVVRRLLDVK